MDKLGINLFRGFEFNFSSSGTPPDRKQRYLPQNKIHPACFRDKKSKIPDCPFI
jgi:hypothetical protein